MCQEVLVQRSVDTFLVPTLSQYRHFLSTDTSQYHVQGGAAEYQSAAPIQTRQKKRPPEEQTVKSRESFWSKNAGLLNKEEKLDETKTYYKLLSDNSQSSMAIF